jgi:two-component system sensor histidine kinase TctE
MTHEQRSLFGEILDWMLAPLLLLWPMSVALTWLVAQGIANRPTTASSASWPTASRARCATTAFDRGLAGRRDLRLGEPTAALLRSDDVDRIYFQVRDAQGDLVGGDAELGAPADERARHRRGAVPRRLVTTTRCASAYLWVGTGAGPNSGWSVQVARPSTSARAWPPRSSRA